MKPLQSILVCTNFSDPCSAALTHAARLAAWDRSRLSVLHTVEVDDWEALSLTTGLSPGELRQRTEEQVRRRFQRLAEAGSLSPEIRWYVRFGAPSEALESVARHAEVDLVVVGAEHRSVAGTLASHAVRTAPAQVLVVRDDHGSEPFRRVLVGVDLGPLSADIVERAVLVAQHERAELHVLHLFSSPWSHWEVGGVPQESEQHLCARRARAEEQLTGLLAPHREALAGLEVHAAVVDEENHSVGILDAARHLGADLVIVGSQGRRDLRDLLLGSTAERVLHLAHCSQWVVKPQRAMRAA